MLLNHIIAQIYSEIIKSSEKNNRSSKTFSYNVSSETLPDMYVNILMRDTIPNSFSESY